MSTNKTPNYQLHSWLPTDEFHVSEINENFTALDAAVGALAKKVLCVTGTYIGAGKSLRIDLGHKPVMVHIETANGQRSTSFVYGGLFGESNGAGYGVTMDASGFTLETNNNINTANVKYCYVAYFI